MAVVEGEECRSLLSPYHQSEKRDKKKFRETRELENGTFIEVKRSAKDIQCFCFQVLEAIELSSEDLKVETTEKLEHSNV